MECEFTEHDGQIQLSRFEEASSHPGPLNLVPKQFRQTILLHYDVRTFSNEVRIPVCKEGTPSCIDSRKSCKRDSSRFEVSLESDYVMRVVD